MFTQEGTATVVRGVGDAVVANILTDIHQPDPNPDIRDVFLVTGCVEPMFKLPAWYLPTSSQLYRIIHLGKSRLIIPT